MWYVLPTIRREMAKELVVNHGMKQAEVARKFEVTDAAISQYLKKKRGKNEVMQNSEHYDTFLEEVKISSSRIAEENADFATEMCRMCNLVKSCGMLAEIYVEYTGFPPPLCALPDEEVNRRMFSE